MKKGNKILDGWVEAGYTQEQWVSMSAKKRWQARNPRPIRVSKSPRLLYPREESSYRNMLSRCTNPKATGYIHYGGRGIGVCPEWRESFWNFLQDMGVRPFNTTLDRIDYDGDYSPDNCRWVDHRTQGNNRSDNVWIGYDGRVQTIAEWARELGVKSNTLQYRFYRGWPLERALKEYTQLENAYRREQQREE